MGRMLFNGGSKTQPCKCNFCTGFLAGIEIMIFPSITLWVEGVQLNEIKVLGNLWCIWEFMVLSVTEEEKAFAHVELSWKIQQWVVLNLEKRLSLFLFIPIAYGLVLWLQAFENSAA